RCWSPCSAGRPPIVSLPRLTVNCWRPRWQALSRSSTLSWRRIATSAQTDSRPPGCVPGEPIADVLESPQPTEGDDGRCHGREDEDDAEQVQGELERKVHEHRVEEEVRVPVHLRAANHREDDPQG